MSTRKPSADRKSEIIQAARTLLAREGESGFSLRTVAREVGIKLASLQYHFATRADLIAAMLDDTVVRYQQGLEDVAGAGGADAREAFCSFLRWFSGIEPPEHQEEDDRLEVHLWAMALTDPVVAKAMTSYHRAYIDQLAGFIAKAKPGIAAHEARMRAVSVASLQEGSILIGRCAGSEQEEQQMLEEVYNASLAIALR